MMPTSQQPRTVLLALLLVFSLMASCQARFALGIRDSFMIAHSFHGHPAFGPAGGLHGATYTCDVEFGSDDIDAETNWVIDIGEASSILATVLAKYNFQNLDEVFAESGELTTTEFMCQQIHRDICELLQKQLQGKDFCNLDGMSICVKLWESHKAWASYTQDIVPSTDE